MKSNRRLDIRGNLWYNAPMNTTLPNVPALKAAKALLSALNNLSGEEKRAIHDAVNIRVQPTALPVSDEVVVGDQLRSVAWSIGIMAMAFQAFSAALTEEENLLLTDLAQWPLMHEFRGHNVGLSVDNLLTVSAGICQACDRLSGRVA